MEHEFWHDRWEQGATAFHQGRVNGMLERHAAVLGDARTVLVPLCGKAVDMAWLRARGHGVLGVELSPIAAEAFFDEQGIACERTRAGPFEAFEGDGVRILCGDFFDLTPADLEDVEAVYDRAALVALPDPLRARYVEHTLAVVPAPAPILLLTFEYPPQDMDGPPFSVGEAAVRALLEPRCTVHALEHLDVLDEEPRLAKRGVTSLTEHAFQVSRA